MGWAPDRCNRRTDWTLSFPGGVRSPLLVSENIISLWKTSVGITTGSAGCALPAPGHFLKRQSWRFYPFTTSRDPDQQFFSDGLTQEMIVQLGKLNPAAECHCPWFGSEVQRRQHSSSQVGKELHADHLLGQRFTALFRLRRDQDSATCGGSAEKRRLTKSRTSVARQNDPPGSFAPTTSLPRSGRRCKAGHTHLSSGCRLLSDRKRIWCRSRGSTVGIRNRTPRPRCEPAANRDAQMSG